MRILNKKRTSVNCFKSDTDFKDFMKIYKRCKAESYSFLVNDATLPSDDPLRFRKNLLK